jgi:serine/threonine protein kinase
MNFSHVSAPGAWVMVWKARDTVLNRIVLVKFSHARFTDRFEREARAVAGLHHPNFAQIYDIGENFIVMEYVDGEPVHAPGEPCKLLDIAVQIADGLAAAHTAGFIHRDLKPDNILMTKSGQVKIVDFGPAKQPMAGLDDGTVAITNPATVAGTVAYMSPEQARGQQLDARSDQFSFGLILYELATGKRAFERPSAAETMTAIIREHAERLPATVPAPLRSRIERCLSKDPASRYHSTRALFLELRTIRDRLT